MLLVQVNSETQEALEHWRDLIHINDDAHRPVTRQLFDGLEPISEYEVEIIAENYLGKSAPTRFVFETSEGLFVNLLFPGFIVVVVHLVHRRSLPHLFHLFPFTKNRFFSVGF